MKKKLYIECNSGISGDMTVAALLDLGVNQEKLLSILKSLPIEGYKIEIKRVKKAGIECNDFNVILDKEIDNHDHDMKYLHERGHEHNHIEQPDEIHGDFTEKRHDPEIHHHHTHDHRNLSDIKRIINLSNLNENARKIANNIFQILAEAEAKAHGVSLEEVHFHEVGAIDSIIDIISVAVCIEELKISDVIFSELNEGKGSIRCQHGILPIPVPAVANIVNTYNIPMHFMDMEGEFVTPTGAAIVAALSSSKRLPEAFTIKKIGMGAGKRNYERPSILRAMIIETEDREHDDIYKLETNIDDCSGEVLGYVMDCLLKNGAKDVCYFPIFMKKNRPAWQLNVLCREEDVSKLEHIIFSETTTIGIRHQKLERTTLIREKVEIKTKYGIVLAKKCKMDEQDKIYPEYDSVVEVCKNEKLPYLDVYNEAIREYEQEKNN